MMLLEWIRRRDVVFARMIKLHTGHEGPIVSEEESGEAAGEIDVERRGEKARAPGAPPPGEAGPGKGERP